MEQLHSVSNFSISALQLIIMPLGGTILPLRFLIYCEFVNFNYKVITTFLYIFIDFLF